MPRTRDQFDGKFKSQIALEAIRGLRTTSEIAKQYQVHPNQVNLWKKQLLDGAEEVLEGSPSSSDGNETAGTQHSYSKRHTRTEPTSIFMPPNC